MSVKVAVVILALVFSVAFASPAKKNNYIEQENSCRQVCGLCDCDGFYCEDECICECNLEEDGNLQCIADMKKECDANGLEYELLMKESTKERFLREVKGNTFDLNKHLVVLKQKRNEPKPDLHADVDSMPGSDNPSFGIAQDDASNAVVGMAAPDVIVGMPLTSLAAKFNGKSAFAAADLQASKLLVTIRERFANLKPVSTVAPIVIPPVTTIAPVFQPKFSLPGLRNLPTYSLPPISLPPYSPPTYSLPTYTGFPKFVTPAAPIVQPENLII